MERRFILTEEERKNIRKQYFFEQSGEKTEKRFCHKGNTKTLEEIVGDDDGDDYIDGVKLRKTGVNGLTDILELMKALRIHNKINDGGEDLAFKLVNTLKSYKPYNYFDETKKECNRAMDKIIELYKENDHGEELVKDIEKIMKLQHISNRAKEFIKHGLGMIKGE
jgi:Mor family transcriptional regulator